MRQSLQTPMATLIGLAAQQPIPVAMRTSGDLSAQRGIGITSG
jgi:hypothetical protein